MRSTARLALHHLLPPRAVKAHDLEPLPPHSVIYSTARITEKKSVFQGHAVSVKSVDEVRSPLACLPVSVERQLTRLLFCRLHSRYSTF